MEIKKLTECVGFYIIKNRDLHKHSLLVTKIIQPTKSYRKTHSSEVGQFPLIMMSRFANLTPSEGCCAIYS